MVGLIKIKRTTQLMLDKKILVSTKITTNKCLE